MARIEKIPTITNPALVDRAIVDVQKGLADALPWLNYAFGRAQRLVKMQGNKKYFTPNVYAGGNEYIPVAPDANIGNFSFFDIEDPQTVDWIPNQRGGMTVNYALIFWFDLRKVSPGVSYRNTEAIKAQILKAINGGFRIKAGRINVGKIYEKAENIYKGYSLDEVENQFLMHPYAGFRFEGIIEINESC